MLSTHHKVSIHSCHNLLALVRPVLRRLPKRCSEFSKAAGRWLFFFHLFGGVDKKCRVMRFSELERAIPAISQKMLIQQLRELERDRIVLRTIYPQIPPRVEYQLTKVGIALRPALRALLAWAALRKEAMPPSS